MQDKFYTIFRQISAERVFFALIIPAMFVQEGVWSKIRFSGRHDQEMWCAYTVYVAQTLWCVRLEASLAVSSDSGR